jgi:hypothetical protein
MFHSQDPSFSSLFGGGIKVQAATVVQLEAEVLVQSRPVTSVEPGPVLALDVSDALLTAAKRRGGLLVKVGHASRGDALLLSMLMRAGRHVAMCVADVGDPEVRACVLACVRSGQLPLLLRSASTGLVTMSKLSDAARATLSRAQGCRATNPQEFAVAVRQHLGLLSDDAFLRQQGVDVRRVRSRTLLLHLPGSLADGSSDDAGERAILEPTLH